MQPRRIGQKETAEWQELYQFYRSLERQERRERQPKLRALTLAAMCVPVLVGMLSIVH